jgi:Flp pilus assembly protein TadG
VEQLDERVSRLIAVKRLRLLRNDDGQAIVEFALVLPLIMGLLLGIVQFGIVFNNYETLTDAARVGARKASITRFVGDNGASAVNAVKSAASGLDQTQLGVTVHSCPPGTTWGTTCTVDDWSTTGNEVTVTATYPYELKILDWVVKTGSLTSTTKERLE